LDIQVKKSVTNSVDFVMKKSIPKHSSSTPFTYDFGIKTNIGLIMVITKINSLHLSTLMFFLAKKTT
jgi:hypothetical protein